MNKPRFIARKYLFRHNPCVILLDNQVFCVVGRDLISKTMGIQEWCFDQLDADAILAKMQASGEFSELKAGLYNRIAA